MNWIVLLIGAAAMWVLGLIYKNPTDMSVAIGLMWMGIAAKAGKELS